MSPAEALPTQSASEVPVAALALEHDPVPAEDAAEESAAAVPGKPPLVRRRFRKIDQEKVSYLRKPQRTVRRSNKPKLQKLIKPGLIALLIVGIPASILAWLFLSPSFALREVTISGVGEAGSGMNRVTEAEVRQALKPLEGKNLLLVSLHDIAGLVEEHPWVKAAAVSKQLPGGLSVRIVERREAALLAEGDDLFYLDQEGRRITRVETVKLEVEDAVEAGAEGEVAAAAEFHDLIRIRSANDDLAEPGPAGLRLMRELDEANPAWLGGLAEIRVLSEEDFEVRTTSLPFPLLMRTGTVSEKVRRLEELLPGIAARYGAGTAVDLRFDRRIIIQPSSSASEAAGSSSRDAAAAGTQ